MAVMMMDICIQHCRRQVTGGAQNFKASIPPDRLQTSGQPPTRSSSGHVMVYMVQVHGTEYGATFVYMSRPCVQMKTSQHCDRCSLHGGSVLQTCYSSLVHRHKAP